MMDRASIIGIALGLAAIAGGTVLEGGKLDSILQPTAAVIVFGGTLGATLLSFPFRDIAAAVRSLRQVFLSAAPDHDGVIRDIVRYANIARRSGFVALDAELPRVADRFLRKALRLAIDGMSARMLRETVEQDMYTYEQEQKRTIRVYETAGGFAPTIGIVGAVLGLIHVMENLSEPSKLGAGIAVAFVATVYGVASANLLLLPIAKKLTARLGRELALREMIVEGVLGILSGINPHYLEERMRACVERKS